MPPVVVQRDAGLRTNLQRPVAHIKGEEDLGGGFNREGGKSRINGNIQQSLIRLALFVSLQARCQVCSGINTAFTSSSFSSLRVWFSCCSCFSYHHLIQFKQQKKLHYFSFSKSNKKTTKERCVVLSMLNLCVSLKNNKTIRCLSALQTLSSHLFFSCYSFYQGPGSHWSLHSLKQPQTLWREDSEVCFAEWVDTLTHEFW